MTTETRRQAIPVQTDELRHAVIQEETELHTAYYLKSKWMARTAIGLGCVAAVLAVGLVGMSYKYADAKAHTALRVWAFDVTGQAHTFTEGQVGFDVNQKLVRDSVRYYLRNWAQDWFSRTRDPNLGMVIEESRTRASVFMSQTLLDRETANEQKTHSLQQWTASAGEQYAVEARPEIVSLVQKVTDGAGKGETRVHLVERFYDTNGNLTATRNYVTVAHFTVDPGYLIQLGATDPRKAEDMARDNPLVLAIESYTPPEQE